MKKKLLLLTLMLALFACAFAISTSATSDCDTLYNGVHDTVFGTCSRANCGELQNDIFTDFGYSTKTENGTACGIVFTYQINQEALASYKEANGSDLVFGVLTFRAEQLTKENGVYQSPAYQMGERKLEFEINKNSNADLTSTGITSIDLILRGDKFIWEQSLASTELYMIGYAYNGKDVYFMGTNGGNDKVSTDIGDISTIKYSDLYELTQSDYTFTLNDDGTATVTGYTGELTALMVIPQAYCGHTVTGIAQEAFKDFGDVINGATTVTGFVRLYIPKTITSIGANAFKNCMDLKLVLYSSTTSSGAITSATTSEINAWANNVTLGEGNEQAVEVIKGQRPAIGWNKLVFPD